ncbi:DUF2798 domain-containing protein [Curvibacter delicatus]|jgi:hypothetical protein|uniref:DUF2798 domain-containing protein n=1 Tax=Curvibacter delicatus TaxID=80879 RepID=UPI00082A1068|nr:DUF2798 domain-containing protein [Curvibacter delicatus]
MLPERYAPVLFGFILSGLMSLVVSAIATFRAAGPRADFLPLWLGAWLSAWLIAFPLVLLVAPVTRRIVQRLAGAPAGPGR